VTGPTGPGGGGGSLSATVTLPASDPNYANTLLLSRFDSGFEDYGPQALSPTVSGSAAISSTQYKFGTRSAYFPSGSESTTNCVRYGSGSQFDICKADFTVEAWVYATAVNNYSGIISRDNQTDRRNWLMLITFDGVKPLQFVTHNTSGAAFVSVTDTVAFPLNQWVHVAAVQDSGVLRLYKNGVQVASASMSSGTGTLSTASGPVTIGALNENGNYGFTGYIDQARVLSTCIYKNGTTFTPSLYPVPDYVAPQTLTVVGTGSIGSGLSWSSVPASASATGAAGTIAYDGSYFYLASAQNTWVRAAMSTWTLPVITIGTQPSSQSASGGAATFSVSASVTQSATLSYQWQKSTNSGSTWTEISGATSASLALTGLTTGDNASQYRVVVSATGGATSVTSSAATLTVASFTATAVLLTSGTSYTVPSGATSMKAWAVGGGGYGYGGGGGGTAYKTWAVTGGSSVTYAVAPAGTTGGVDRQPSSTVTYGGTTITGQSGRSTGTGSSWYGTYSGGDGGANGGDSPSGERGGAVGGNGTVASCGRVPMTDVSGIKAAVAAAGGKTVEDCGTAAAFGSGAAGKFDTTKAAGYGGGGGATSKSGGSGAVVLYFT
jgi:hypothetical protein